MAMLVSPRLTNNSTRRFRPQLEGLEERNCPSGANPVLDLHVEYLGQNNIRVYGTVQDELPTSNSVYVSGPLTGNSPGMATPAADGSFSLNLQTNAPGTITGFAVDDTWQMSNCVWIQVGTNTPQILNFTATRQSGNFWIFTGSVQDEDPEGLTVHFGGLDSLNGETAVVQTDGTFSLCVELGQGEEGIANAIVTDWWNVASQYAEVGVYPA